MPAAWLLTFLALAGVVFGALGSFRSPEEHSRASQLAAGGGGLLVGICMFWILPELVSVWGGLFTVGLLVAIAAGLVLLDRALAHSSFGVRQSVVLPLLAATAVHSFLDGWSVRALSVRPLETVAVPIGLGLHKLPEGLALGWITAKKLRSGAVALFAAAAVESLTVVGAFIEPRAERSGVAVFGPSWTGVVLAIVGGSFLFLGAHAVLAERRKSGVVLTFTATFAGVGCLSLFRASF